MHILKTFRLPFKDQDGDWVDSEAFVYTSPAQMIAFSKAVHCIPTIETPSGPARVLAGMADTTFKMIAEGWVESQYGLRTLARAPNGSISQKFLPFLCAVARTENNLVYREMFDCIRLVEKQLISFKGIAIPRFIVGQFCSDANDGLIKAAEETLCEEPQDGEDAYYAESFSDWSHISRNALTRVKDKLQKQSYAVVAQRHLDALHLCRSRKQFLSLANLVMQEWRIQKEYALATWFESELLPLKWSINDTGFPGQDPNSQPLESDHRDQKRTRHGEKQLTPLQQYLTKSLPAKLGFIANKLTSREFHFTTPPGAPHRNVNARAYEFVQTDTDSSDRDVYQNYFRINIRGQGGLKMMKQSDRIIANGSIVFNSSENMIQKNIDNSVDKTKAFTYVKSLMGVLPAKLTCLKH